MLKDVFVKGQMKIVPISSESPGHPLACFVASAAYTAHTHVESQQETAGCHAAHMRSDRKSVCQIQEQKKYIK